MCNSAWNLYHHTQNANVNNDICSFVRYDIDQQDWYQIDWQRKLGKFDPFVSLKQKGYPHTFAAKPLRSLLHVYDNYIPSKFRLELLPPKIVVATTDASSESSSCEFDGEALVNSHLNMDETSYIFQAWQQQQVFAHYNCINYNHKCRCKILH